MSMSWDKEGHRVINLKQANKAVKELQATKDLELRILPIPCRVAFGWLCLMPRWPTMARSPRVALSSPCQHGDLEGQCRRLQYELLAKPSSSSSREGKPGIRGFGHGRRPGGA